MEKNYQCANIIKHFDDGGGALATNCIQRTGCTCGKKDGFIPERKIYSKQTMAGGAEERAEWSIALVLLENPGSLPNN